MVCLARRANPGTELNPRAIKYIDHKKYRLLLNIRSKGNLRVQPDLTLDELPSDTAALVLNGATQSWRDLSDENRLKIADLVRKFKQ